MTKGKEVCIPDPPKTPKEAVILMKACSKPALGSSSWQFLTRTPLRKEVGVRILGETQDGREEPREEDWCPLEKKEQSVTTIEWNHLMSPLAVMTYRQKGKARKQGQVCLEEDTKVLSHSETVFS